MKKECIFKIWHNGCWSYVYDCGEPKEWVEGRFRVYRGRRWLAHVAFSDKQWAIKVALHCALGDDFMDFIR